MSDCTEGFEALTDAEQAYREAHDYYSGTVAEVFASRALKRALRKTGDRFKMNVIKAVPDAVGDRLEVMSATVVAGAGADKEPGGGSPASSSPAQVALDRIIEANSMTEELPNVLHRAGEFGDAFVMVWPNADDENAPPVMNYLSPLTMRVIYDRDNPRKKKFAAHMWTEKRALGEVVRMNLLYPDRVERWETKLGTKPDDAASWVESLTDESDPDSWTAENPYGEVPVFHFRNATPYGFPEHFNGYGAQDAVNKIVIAHMSTVDFHLAPQRYALLDAEAADDDADEFDMEAEFDDAEEPKTAEEREARKGLRSGAGEVWWLKGVKEVGQFDPADGSTFISPATFYLRMMAQTTNTPLHIVDESGDEPSGESRRRKEGPLVKKVKDRQRMYGRTIEEMYAFALKVDNYADRRVVVAWAPAEVVSDAEGWSTIKAKMEAGVPVRQALAEAGYTTEQIDEWFPEGEENAFRVADLVSVADILQKLGAAVAMGIVSAEEARAMLPEGALPDGAPIPTPPAVPDVPEV